MPVPRSGDKFHKLPDIQEQDDDRNEDITLPLPSNTISPQEQGTSNLERDSQVAHATFLQQDIQQRQQQIADQKLSPTIVPGHETELNPLAEKFPTNVIQLHAAQKQQEAARGRPTAGVNPDGGSNRGTSFITTRSHLCDLKDDFLNPQQGEVFVKALEVSKYPESQCWSTSRNTKCRVYYSCRSVFPGASSRLEFSQTLQQDQKNKHTSDSACFDQQHVHHRDFPANGKYYQPDVNLSLTVNPIYAPANQFCGSLAYDLKTTPPRDITASVQNSKSYPQSRRLQSALSRTSPTIDDRLLLVEDDLHLPPNKQDTTINHSSVFEASQLRDSLTLQSSEKDISIPLYIPRETNTRTENICAFPSGHSTLKLFQGITLHDSSEIRYSNQNRSIRASVPKPDPRIIGESITTIPSSKDSGVVTASSLATNTNSSNMYSVGEIRGMNTSVGPVSRLHEKEELQRLNDRFSAYVTRVRHLGQQANNVDSSAFLRSTKVLEEEITSLKNMYQTELDKLRNEIDASAYERNSLHAQSNQQHKCIGELQDRLTIETDKNSRLLDDINILKRRIGNLEAEVQDARIAVQRPQEEVDQLQISVENMTREVDQWKHRYEQEQLANHEREDRLQQMIRKVEFSEQVQNQQIKDYQSRLDTAAASILSLEAHVRELSTSGVSVSEILKQVQGKAEAELRKFQMESEEQYSRNLSALKAQIDCNADTIQRFSQEKSELVGSIGELHAKIRNLEGQIANLQHQKVTLEETVTVERKRAADNIHQLEKKLRDVQNMLVTKMYEQTSAQESNVPLKTEIEALNALLEEEERRLRVPVSTAPSMPHLPTASEIMRTNSLSAIKAATSSHPQPAELNGSAQSLTGSKKANALGAASPLHPCDLYPYFSTSYIPEALQIGEENKLAYYSDFDSGFTEYDLYNHEVSQPETKSQYYYETTPSLNRLHVEPTLPLTSRPLGPIQSRAGSVPAQDSDVVDTTGRAEKKTKEKKWNYIPANFGCGRDYFEEMFYDLQKNSPLSKERPNSSPLERQMPSHLHDYTVTTSSALDDIKILEVNQDGKYVRLVNDGPRELDIGGYLIRQNVDGHPVAIFKFPPHVKFLSNSTITVWSAVNDPKLHNPPTDFFWKDLEKWGVAPECSTILCRSNGQAVAWTTAAHRHSRGAAADGTKSQFEKDNGRNGTDEECFNEQIIVSTGPKTEPVNLRREKQQPPLLANTQNSHGSNSLAAVQPESKRPGHFGKENNPYSNQSKTQVVPGHPHGGAPVQFVGSMTFRTTGTGQQTRPPTIRGNGTLVNKQMSKHITQPDSRPAVKSSSLLVTAGNRLLPKYVWSSICGMSSSHSLSIFCFCFLGGLFVTTVSYNL